jgi:predicted dehydrogenase
MKKSANTSRRTFIKNAALTSAGITIIPRSVLGRGFVAPSDQLNIAVIGGGGKGYSDAVNAWDNGNANIAAICDVDWGMASKAFEKFPNAKKYKDFRKLFDAMSDLDAITVSTPDHTHAVITKAAMDRGMHTYVQKTLTHSIYEARV